jgi:DNA-binding protein HU-beta
MNKSDLVNEVATITGLTKTKSTETIDTIISVIESTLAKGEKVSLVGFGSWETSKRAERIARNPKTGEEVRVPSKTVAKFKPGATLNQKVNN